MDRPSFVLVAFLLSLAVSAQKVVEKTIDNPKTKFVQINGDKCFKVVLNTHDQNMLKIEASMEGEYAKDLVLKLEENGDNIGISADFIPSFSKPNDKLSAHKVISILLSVTLPNGIATTVFGTNTHVFAEGDYQNLAISLADGNCMLKNIGNDVQVKTQNGEILVEGAKGWVKANSQYGTVTKGKVPKGVQTYSLSSVEGDIQVNINNG